MKHKIVIFTVASEHYLIYLERFLASSNLFFQHAIIHVALINVDKLQVPYLKSLYNNLELDHHDIEFNNFETLKGYCGNLYSRILPDLMDQYNYPIIYMDSDSLFVNNADELYEYSKLYDVSCQINFDHPNYVLSNRKLRKVPKGPLGTPYYGVMNSAVITTNNSEKAKEFFKYNREIINEKKYTWFADQESLYLTYQKFKKRIIFNPLDEKFCSGYNQSDTIIWRAKGETRKNNEYLAVGRNYINIIRNRKNKRLDESGLYNNSNNHNDYFKYKIFFRLKKALKILFTGKIH